MFYLTSVASCNVREINFKTSIMVVYHNLHHHHDHHIGIMMHKLGGKRLATATVTVITETIGHMNERL